MLYLDYLKILCYPLRSDKYFFINIMGGEAMNANKKKSKKTRRAVRPSGTGTDTAPTLAEVESSMDRIAIKEFAESARADMKRLGDKIHDAADQGIHVVKEIAKEVRKFSLNATDLTKVKVDLHNLSKEKERRYALLGKKLKKLYNTQKLTNIKSKFNKDFEKLGKIESEIAQKKKLETRLSKSIGTKKRKTKR